MSQQVAFLRYLPLALRALHFELSAGTRPVGLWLMDESRFGLWSDLGRRLTLPGIAPVAVLRQNRQNFWLYGATEVLQGETYLRTFHALKSTSFQCFIDDLTTLYPEQDHILLLDNSATHAAQTLRIPDSLRLLFLPPYSPELNPIERLWQHLKAPLKGSLPASLFALQEQLATFVEQLSDETILSLVSPTWLLEAARKAGFLLSTSPVS